SAAGADVSKLGGSGKLLKQYHISDGVNRVERISRPPVAVPMTAADRVPRRRLSLPIGVLISVRANGSGYPAGPARAVAATATPPMASGLWSLALSVTSTRAPSRRSAMCIQGP